MHRFVVCAFLLACGLPAHAETIADGIELVPGEFRPGPQPDGNSILFHTTTGLVVFDTGRHATHTQQVLDAAHAAHQPIVAVINSHWHLDHIGGNARIRAAYPSVHVYASNALADARSGFLANYRHQLEGAIAQSTDANQQQVYRDEIALIDAGDALAPDRVVRGDQTLRIGGRKLELHVSRHSVTAGDVWLFDPATHTLVAGDLVTLPAPLFDTACPARWSTALAQLDRVDFTRLVPGHGKPMTHAQLTTYRQAFDHLLACAASTSPKAQCTDGWIADAGPLLAGGDRAFARSLLDYYLDQSLRGDPKKAAALCGT